MYPEFQLADAEREGLARRPRRGAGRPETAERYGWKVGDRIPIQATIWRKKDG